MRHLGLRAEGLIDITLGLLEMAGEGMGEAETLGSAVARVGGRQSLNAERLHYCLQLHKARGGPAVGEQLYCSGI